MAYHFTSSRAQRPSEIECNDVQPSEVAPVAATSSTFVGPSVAAVGGPESMATEPAESVSVLIHPSPAGRPSFQGGLGVPGPAGPPRVGDSMGYPSGLAGPSVMSTHSREQLSSSGIATVVDTTPASSSERCGSRPPPPRRLPLEVLQYSLMELTVQTVFRQNGLLSKEKRKLRMS